MTKKQHYMTLRERDKLEAFLRAKKGVSWIARELGFTRQTIYNEIKRGTYMHTRDAWDSPRYSADKGQDIQRRRAKNKGRGLKIGKDWACAASPVGACTVSFRLNCSHIAV